MTDQRNRSDGDNEERPKEAADRSRQDAGFDRWLTGHLREMYDEVLREAVPEDLVRMIRQFDRGPEEGGSGEQHQAEDAEAGAHSSRRRSGR